MTKDRQIWQSCHLLAKNAGIAQIYYEGFEYLTSSNAYTTLPFAGGKCYRFASAGSLPLTMPSSATYKITYWTRVNSGNWTLVETTFTGTNYSINGVALQDIDEIRIHPVNALMISYSYDRFGNLISECDANNKIITHEYDEFNRRKLTRDGDRDILEYNTYNIKN